MSKAQGINTKMNIVLGLMISNGIVALAGALLAQYQVFADINMGRGAIVIGLCAVVIGGALFSKIAKNFAVRLLTVAVGGVIYYFVFQTVIFLGLDTDMLKMLSAIVVAIFLGVPYIRRTYWARFKKWRDNRRLLKEAK
jgi:putative ABC transport system permease protein